MIRIQDWMAAVPPEDRSIAYVGEGDAVQRLFLLSGEGWETYTDWSFHLDMAFDLSSVTSRDTYESETTTETAQVNASENQTKEQSENLSDTAATLRSDQQSTGENARTASTTKEKRTVTRVTVADVQATDVASLEKEVLAGEGLRLCWRVLRQQTQLPGRLRATLRAVGPAGEIKKSSLMVFQVEPAVVAQPAATLPVSEFEEMEQRLDALVEGARQCAVQTARDATDASLYRDECQQLTAQTAGYTAQALDGVAVVEAAQVQAQLAAQRADSSAEEAANMAQDAAGSASSAARSEAQAALRTTEAGVARDQAAESAAAAYESMAAAAAHEAGANAARHNAETWAKEADWKQHAANAIQGEAAGEVATLTDVSPVEHALKVTLSGEGITDFSSVVVTRCGKNLFDISKVEHVISSSTGEYLITNNGDGSITVKGGATSRSTGKTLKELCPALKVGDTVRISAVTDGTKAIALRATANKMWYFRDAKTITETDLNSKVYFYGVSSENDNLTISNIQIELGESVTDYEPYKSTQTATANADGTVTGLTSVSPNTVLSADTAGVVIHAQYSKDTNKVIQRLVEAIISLGGNV